MLDIDSRLLSRCLFNEANDGFLIIEPGSKRILDANPTMQRLTGLRRRELINMELGELVRGITERATHDLLDACQTTVFFHSHEDYELVHANGNTTETNITVSRIHNDDGIYGLVVVRDISDRKEAEKATRESERRFRLLFENCGFPICFIDGEGVFLFANSNAAENLGVPAVNVIGKSLHNFFATEHAADYLRGIRQVIRDNTPLIREEEVETSHGPRWFWSILHPYRNSQGQTVGVQIVSHDITEKKKNEVDLKSAYDQLEKTHGELKESQSQMVRHERLMAVGELACGVAHDLNNLLTPAVTYLRMLVNRTDLPADAHHQLQTINTAIADAADVVQRLQMFYRPNVERRTEPVDLVEIVKQIPDLTRGKWRDNSLAVGRHVTLELDVTEPVPLILANPSEIRQLLSNLVFNSVDAIPQQGTITLAVRPAADHVTLCVSDDGTGMPADVRDRCREPFFTTKPAGSGLGLSVSHGIVEAHQGTMQIESNLDQGTEIVINLPLPQQEQVQKVQLAAAPELQPMRVLYVDDDKMVRGSIAALLGTTPVDLDLAESGEQAVKQLKLQSYDAVITDWGMPGMDGRELTEYIKRHYPRTPVLIASGWPSSRVMQEFGDQLRPDGLITKPTSPANLLAALSKVQHSDQPEEP